jgi:hypothetical protein
VDFDRHDTNVLSLITTAVNKACIAVPKAGRPAVKTLSGFGDGPQSILLCVAKAVPFRLGHQDGSTTLSFSEVAIAQNEAGLLAGKYDMAAFLTNIQMSPTLTTCSVLHNTSPIVLVDSGGHLFARLAEPTMEEPGESFVLLYKKKNGAVFAKVKTAPANSPAPMTNPRVDVSVTNGGSS